jgi:T5orf172 domain
VNGYYDNFEAAKLLNVDAATVRSWVKRGVLQQGQYLGGRLRWTKRQLVAARDRVRGDVITPSTARASVIEAQCGCGTLARSTPSLDGYILIQCHGCGASMAIQTANEFIYRSHIEAVEISPSADPQAVLGSRAAMIEVDRSKGQPFVYFIRLGPYVKIGTSSDVRGRIGALSLAPGNLLAVIPGSFEVEKSAHKRFSALRAFREWFYLQDELLAYVKDLQRDLVERLIGEPDGPA